MRGMRTLLTAILFTVGTLSLTSPAMAQGGTAGNLHCASNTNGVILVQDSPSVLGTTGWVYIWAGTYEYKSTWPPQYLGVRTFWLAIQVGALGYDHSALWDSFTASFTDSFATYVGNDRGTLYVQVDYFLYPNGTFSTNFTNIVRC